MRIDSQSIFLTSITYNDTADIVRWRNQKFIQENFIYQTPFTPEIHNKWMQTMVEPGHVIQFIIWERKSNLKIGSVFLRLLAHNKCALKCYLDCGFIQEGLFKQDVFIKNQPQDVIFMAIFRNTNNK